jgi:hypothetical protein
MTYSQFAEELNCAHCGSVNRSEQWPSNGDEVPFYYQKEPGNYNIKLICPNCKKTWYVVWDENPGPIGEQGF